MSMKQLPSLRKEEINKKYSKYSLGTKQKLGIAQVLMEDPELIVLDEPLNGIENDTAKEVRKILNEEKKKVVLDFKGINVVSSSFADELIGKIVAEKGFFYFTQLFEIKNLSPFNINVVNRSVEQRMAQKYYDENISDVD